MELFLQVWVILTLTMILSKGSLVWLEDMTHLRCRSAKKGIEPLLAVQVAEDLGREEMASLENFMWDGAVRVAKNIPSWMIFQTSHHGSPWTFGYKEVDYLVTTEIFLATNKEVPTDHPTRRNRREMIGMIYLNTLWQGCYVMEGV